LVARQLIAAGNLSEDDGGGLDVNGSTLSLSFASIVSNGCFDAGGGLYLWEVDATLDHVDLSNNLAATHGGGLVCDGCAPAIRWGNVWANLPTNVESETGDPTGADGNIAVHPAYILDSGTDLLAWDLHLVRTSELVDAGDPTTPDPDGSPADIGAYGGSDAAGWDRDGDGYPEWWQPGPYEPAIYPGAGWDCDDLDGSVDPGNGC
jgi:hypothetical protein